MKVLFVASGNRKKNGNVIIEKQAESLMKNDIDVDYFFINKKGIIGYLSSVPELRNYLINNKTDIIHSHYGLCGIVSYLAKKNEKTIVSFMGDDIIGSVGKGNSYTLIGKLISRVNKYFSKRFYDFSIVKSVHMFNILNSDEKVRIIPNGVNLNTFIPISSVEARKKLKIGKEHKLILFPSDPKRYEKNFVLLKRALDLIPEQNIKIIVANGFTQNELNTYYNAVNCTVLTSFHEGSPNSIKEAMACNCPIVSTNVGDVEWILGDTKGCYLSSFDIGDLSYKIKLAIEFSDKFERTKGRDRIVEIGLDSEIIAHKIIEIYKKVVGS